MKYETLLDRILLRISGPDSIKFLQNLTTNDLLQNNKWVYSYFLSPQGRYLFDFFSYYYDGIFLLDIDKSQQELFLAKLKLYKMRSKVEIELLEDKQVVYSYDTIDSKITGRDPRYYKLGLRSIIDSSSPVLEHSEKELYLSDKYSYTIPDGVTDLEFDKSFPQEFGAEQLNALSYSKGCYVGQEVISRTKYQGVIRKRVCKITSSDNSALQLSKNDLILSPSADKIGKICSCYNGTAIALIRLTEANELFTRGLVNDINVNIVIAEWY